MFVLCAVWGTGIAAQPQNYDYLKLADYYKFVNEDSCLYFANQAYREALEQKNIEKQAKSLCYPVYVNRYKGNYDFQNNKSITHR